MSENTGPETINQLSRWRLGSVGHPIHGAQVKLDNPVDGEGEVRRVIDNSSDESNTFGAENLSTIMGSLLGKCSLHLSNAGDKVSAFQMYLHVVDGIT